MATTAEGANPYLKADGTLGSRIAWYALTLVVLMQAMSMVDRQVLSIYGDARITSVGQGSLAGSEIHLWLKDVPKVDAPPPRAGEKPATELAPDRMLALGDVRIDSPQLLGEALLLAHAAFGVETQQHGFKTARFEMRHDLFEQRGLSRPVPSHDAGAPLLRFQAF